MGQWRVNWAPIAGGAVPDFMRRPDKACTDVDPEIFYPLRDYGAVAQEAKDLCNVCPVKRECLDYALVTGDDWGIWAGLTGPERRKISRSQRVNA